MTLYFVLDVSAADGRVRLYDSFGRYHLARALDTPPSIGAELCGSAPTPGSSIRNASATGEVFGVVFEVVDCGRSSELRRTHESRSPGAGVRDPPEPGAVPLEPERRTR